MGETFLTVTDLKQWSYCPRVAYYMRCLPSVRPTTYRMRVAHDAHADEADRERRRSLRTYHLQDGEREFDVEVSSSELGLRGKVDLVVTRRREVSLSASALGVVLGCRILRVHDVAGTVRVRDALARVAEVEV